VSWDSATNSVDGNYPQNILCATGEVYVET
jgi:hypothetical protein